MRSSVVLAAVLGAGLSSCISRGVDIVPFLAPTATTTLEGLVARVNAWEEIHSLVVRVDLQFETVEETEKGKGRQYRTANGRLIVRRPSSIRLNIQAPVLSADIAEMASDGKRFQLLIHPPQYRALLSGSNDASYREEKAKIEKDPELGKAGPLLNIRPQHFTGAFLPAVIDAGTEALLHEEQVTEHDPRPGAKKNAAVRKSYYVLTAVRKGARSPHAQFWFDRIGNIALVRQRVFDAQGYLVTDIRYEGWLPPSTAGGHSLPARVRIERPYDEYALVVTVRSDGILVNRDLPENAFVLEVPPEWEDSLRRIDLDESARN
ncbi:MAG: hypothetical protein ACRD1Z_12095 [Vicinamibacteria bacterium]